MSGIRVGSYVTHSLRPAWGVGKVFGQSPQHVLVGFAGLPETERFKRMEWRPGLLERALEVKSDSELDSWKVECDSTCHYIGAIARPKRTAKAALWSREDAMERFLKKYSNGFPDAWYRSSHRDARLAQHKLWQELLPDARLRELAGDRPHIAAQHIIKVLELREKPLLNATSELPRVRAAMMRTEKMTPFLIALADILEARPTAPQYANYLAAFAALESPAKKTPMTWPIVTALPFIAHPDRHMFVKPTATRAAALGLGFDLKFKSAPNWVTYDRVLAFSDELMGFIKPRSGEDMIDVQAFITAIVEP
jgi:hypothetical protein